MIKLLNYNASNLYLELEYDGQDLLKFVDVRGILGLSKDIVY